MNPLGVSVIFVICSVLLTFLKHFIFPSDENGNSVASLNKILQLTNNKVQMQSKHYKSLYQAYYKHEFQDAYKNSMKIANRKLFNQTILSQSLKNGQISFLCGGDFLVLVYNGIQQELDQIKSINTIQVYQLPLLIKQSQFKIQGQIYLPEKCKKYPLPLVTVDYNETNKYEYEIVIVNKNQYMKLEINRNYTELKKMKKNKNQIVAKKFDFFDNSIGYYVQDKPWIIQIQNILQQQKVLVIDLLNLSKNTHVDGQKLISKSFQQVRIRKIILDRHFYSQNLYVSVVYDTHEYGDKIHYVKFSSFKIYDQQLHEIKTLLMYIQHINFKNNNDFCECQTFFNKQTTTYDISCTRQTSTGTNFIHLQNIFTFTQKKLQQLQKNQQAKINIIQQNVQQYQQQQKDYFDDFIDYFIQQQINQQQQQQQKKQIKSDLTIFSLKNIGQTSKRLIKASTPDPIMMYEQDQRHYILTFNIPYSMQRRDQQFSISTFKLQAPVSQNKQQKSLRDIIWIEEQNIILVIWGAGIELYQYSCFVFPQDSSEGIAMSVILPFIELFATVFCLLRIIWQ